MPFHGEILQQTSNLTHDVLRQIKIYLRSIDTSQSIGKKIIVCSNGTGEVKRTLVLQLWMGGGGAKLGLASTSLSIGSVYLHLLHKHHLSKQGQRGWHKGHATLLSCRGGEKKR